MSIEYDTFIDDIDVYSVSNNRGYLILNKKYDIRASCKLIEVEGTPHWIKRDYRNYIYRASNYKYIPMLFDVKAPFVLSKKENENVFSVIKYGDTLYFNL